MRRVLRTVAHAAGMARHFPALGFETSVAVVGNSLAAAAANRRDAPGREAPQDPGALVEVGTVRERRTDRSGRQRRVAVGLRCTFTHADVEVRFLADDLLRVSWGPDPEPEPWALAGDPLDERPGRLGSVKVTADRDDPGARSATLAVRVRPDGSVLVLTAAGELLAHELPPLRAGRSREHRQLLRQGERLVGLGEQAGGLALAGPHRLWNRDPGGGWAPGTDPLYCVVPVVIGLHPGGNVLTFFENPAQGEVEITGAGPSGGPPAGSPARLEARFSSGMLRHYVAAGPL
ncbi:MAG TPA: hypothetical protein VMD28_04480, partial [Acidimicrobiales bacterium]|nr:hypothetical protein [Acidimicrobiales bacterium]